MWTEVTNSKQSGMSDRCWVTTTVPHLLLLFLNCCICTGIIQVCSLCCVLRSQDEGLNCTWSGNADTQRTLYLHSLKYNSDHSSDLNFTSIPGQNWLLIPRHKLTKYDQYHLRLEWEDGEDTLTITYEDNGENVLIQPPILSPIVMFNEEDPTIAEVAWTAPGEGSHYHEVELWYRKLGQDGWLEAEPSDLEAGTYEMTKLDPFTKYQVKIRYLPDESSKNMGSLWSEPISFETPEAVPTGPLDLWRHFGMGEAISLVWKPLDDQSARGHILNYTVVYDHSGKSYTKEASCCEVKLPSNSTRMCVSARNSKGNGPSTCAAPPCSAQNLSSVFAAERTHDAGITVRFGEPPPSDHPTYLIEWIKITGHGNAMITWTRSQAANRNVTLPGTFLPHVPYHVSVFALYQNSCRGPFSTIVYSHQGVPSAAPDFSVTPLSPKDALIFWTELPVWQQRGVLSHYTVYLNSTAGSQQHTAKGRSLTLSDLVPGTLYHVWVTASTAAGEGPPGALKSFHTIGSGHDVALIVFMVLASAFLFLGAGPLICKLWPQKIPSPKNSSVEAGNFSPSDWWLLKQASLQSPITVVEEVELLPAALPPPVNAGQTPVTVVEDSKLSVNESGYEKHFMPTREEVMGLH